MNVIAACPMCGEPGIAEYVPATTEKSSAVRVASTCGVLGKAFHMHHDAQSVEEALRLAIDHWNSRTPPKGQDDV